MSDFRQNWKNNKSYFETLSFLASLSGLFSDSSIPYLDYRLAENIFCSSFSAVNDARSCTAYDAHLETLGIGIKTFILNNNASTEKIAEFNKLKQQLDPLNGIELAQKLAQFRNERIDFADNAYGISNRLYHIIGRCQGFLRFFNVPYEQIDITHLHILKDDGKSFSFSDGLNIYSFNRSKSVLLKRFEVPRNEYQAIPVEIIANPIDKLKAIFCEHPSTNLAPMTSSPFITKALKKGVDYVILPLFSTRGERQIPLKSGLNQWNADGRPRDPNEVYIPIPKRIHDYYPHFFPPRNEHFILELPDKQRLSAKVCQDNGKALMSTHNADLGKWLLRKVLKKAEGELVTIDDLDTYGIDSVMIVNKHTVDSSGMKVYSITFTEAEYETYDDFFE